MSKNLFNSIQVPKVKSNFFDLSHDVKLSLDMGNLVPIMALECVPGDRHTISAESLIRMAPMIAPVMHNINVYTHFFFVPNRIIWPQFEDWITGNTDVAFPVINTFNPGLSIVGGLADYLGLPVRADSATHLNDRDISALPFAAYQKIYDDYYRDQNLQDEVLSTGNGFPNGVLSAGVQSSTARNALQILRKRAWKHDYFTSALPWAQKGAAVELPLLGQLDDVSVGSYNGSQDQGTSVAWTASAPSGYTVRTTTEQDVPAGVLPGSLFARTSELQGASATINDLRTSIRLQEWLERNARGGTRYNESIYAHFGVRSSDKRLQRPEYITGSSNPVRISEVLQNSETDVSPQGNMAGHGIAVTSGNKKSYYCEEHGYIIGIMSILPATAYQDGIPRHFLKDDRMLYYWPSFAHLGEQEIWNKELILTSNASRDDATFGYTPRYAEYKYMDSRVAGEFRTSLDYWHLGRKFDPDSPPNLNAQFIEANVSKRIFAVTDDDTHSIYAHVFNRIHSRRPMPKYGTPFL